MPDFTADEKEFFYRLILARRDIRKFQATPIPPEIIDRIIWAAHHAGSVGFMQPWNFIVIKDKAVKASVRELYAEANECAAKTYDDDRQALYRTLKLEGITESPVNICVTCDRSRGGNVLGRHTMPETDLFSTCTAVQNLWLAARVEGVGVGWVSILDNVKLAKLLNLPDTVYPVAYLCVGYPVEFAAIPELESVGWASRLDVGGLVYEDRWPEETEAR